MLKLETVLGTSVAVGDTDGDITGFNVLLGSLVGTGLGDSDGVWLAVGPVILVGLGLMGAPVVGADVKGATVVGAVLGLPGVPVGQTMVGALIGLAVVGAPTGLPENTKEEDAVGIPVEGAAIGLPGFTVGMAEVGAGALPIGLAVV